MKIIIDIGHPAHVHLFKNLAREMSLKGHDILFTCREKEFEVSLLTHYGFNFKSFGKKYNSKTGKLWGILEFGFKEFVASLKFKPDLFLSHGSMYAAHAAFLLGKPHISLEDTGNWEQVRLYLPFTKAILTSDIFPIDYGKKQIRYPSHHEIAYLHPKWFKPDIDFFKSTGINDKEPYAIVRFVAWNASHDIGEKGLSNKLKLDLINRLSVNYKVMISSEGELPDNLEKYRTNFKPWQIHDALYNASLFIGEGTTMAMEAAILGTPTIYVNSLQYANIFDLRKFGLIYNLSNEENLLSTIDEIDHMSHAKLLWKQKACNMLKTKIDLTTFLIWFISNYPNSQNIAREKSMDLLLTSGS